MLAYIQLLAISIFSAFRVCACTMSRALYILYIFIYVICGTWHPHLCRWGGHVPCTRTAGICRYLYVFFVCIRLLCITCVHCIAVVVVLCMLVFIVVVVTVAASVMLYYQLLILNLKANVLNNFLLSYTKYAIY